MQPSSISQQWGWIAPSPRFTPPSTFQPVTNARASRSRPFITEKHAIFVRSQSEKKRQQEKDGLKRWERGKIYLAASRSWWGWKHDLAFSNTITGLFFSKGFFNLSKKELKCYFALLGTRDEKRRAAWDFWELFSYTKGSLMPKYAFA